jgi:hypothetical protein
VEVVQLKVAGGFQENKRTRMGRTSGFLHHLRSSKLTVYGTLQSFLTTILGVQIDATSSGV